MKHSFTLVRFVGLLCCILLGQGALAQYGPGGIGNADGSNGQPRLLLWLDGSSVEYNGSNVVTKWNDKSGNGQDFLPAAGANITYVANALNTNPGVAFDGGINSYLKRDNFESPTDEFTIYIVYQSTDSRFGLFNYSVGSNPNELLISRNGASIYTRIGAGERLSSIKPSDNSNSYWSYAGMLWGNTGSKPIWEYDKTNFYESANDKDYANGVTVSSGGTAIIGQIEKTGGQFSLDSAFTGKIAEVIVYSGYINKAETRILRSYVREKYNIGQGGGWDKFNAQGGYSTSPAAIGRDVGGTEHLEASSDGIVLASTPGGLNGNYSYLLTTHEGVPNSIVSSNLSGSVQARWNRIWFIRSDVLGSNSTFTISFDFSDGINGMFPIAPENYVLLIRQGASGNFTEVPLSDDISTKYVVGDRIVFFMDIADLPLGSDRWAYITLGTRNAAVSPLDGQVARSWFAYQTGNWNDPLTWTLDGSAAPAYVNPGGDIPGSGDYVYIGSGRTVTAVSNNLGTKKLGLFGTLNLAQTENHNFTQIYGNGRLKTAKKIPAGDMTAFADPLSGGTVELYGSGMEISAGNPLVANKLEMNMDDVNATVDVKSDVTLNGNFMANEGNFQIFSNGLDITTHGDVLVEAGAKLSVRAATITSYWNFYGDLHNLGGEVRFTTRTAPDYTAEDTKRVEAFFLHDTKNQTLQADGITYLSRLVVDKGGDMTYKLTVSAENQGDFGIFGKCNYGFSAEPYMTESQNKNSVVVVNGTLEAQENVFLPLGIVASNNYSLNESASIWLNGGSAERNTGEAIVVYGLIKVSGGILNANIKSGLTTRGTGTLIVEGGTANLRMYRTSVYGSENVGGLIITGGTVNIGDGSTNMSDEYYTLSLTYPGNVFKMSGGELYVRTPTTKGLVFINSNPANVSITGGEVFFIADVNRDANICSRAPFWNLTLRRTTSSDRYFKIKGGSLTIDSETMTVPALPLRVKGRLHLESDTYTPTLDMNNGSNPDLDLYVDGDFRVDAGATYLHGTNTTFFTGASISKLYLPTAASQTFYNLVVDKDPANRYVQISTGYNDPDTFAIEVQNDLKLMKGNFINGDKNVSLKGNMELHTTFGNDASTGFLKFEGTTAQNIASFNGVIHKLKLANNATADNEVILTAGDLVLKQKLDFVQFATKKLLFDIGQYKLTLDTNFVGISFATPGVQAIISNGLSSAGGIEFFFSNEDVNTTYNYPLAVLDASNHIKSVPATVRINSSIPAGQGGYIALTPVAGELPLADVTAGDMLQFYWKMKVRGFATIPTGGLNFTYQQTDVEGNEANYFPGKVLDDFPFERSTETQSQVQTSNNNVFFTSSQGSSLASGALSLVNANYTAGDSLCFDGKPKVYFSNNYSYVAVWTNKNYWNDGSQFSPGDGPYQWHSSTAIKASEAPGPGSVAIIGYSVDQSPLYVPHQYALPPTGAEVAEIRFSPYVAPDNTPLPRFEYGSAVNIYRHLPGIRIPGSATVGSVRSISGAGEIHIEATGDVDFGSWFGSVDIGGVLSQDSSIILLSVKGGNRAFSNLPTEVPNLYITSGNNGDEAFAAVLNSAVNVRNYLDVKGNAKLRLSGTVDADMLIGSDLRLTRYYSPANDIRAPEFQFPGSGFDRRVLVNGKISMDCNGSKISVYNPDNTQQAHVLEVKGNIYQKTAAAPTSLDFYTADDEDFISLRLTGEGQHSYINNGGKAPDLWNLVVDKGSNISSGFAFNTDVNINGPSDLSEKSVDLKNGLLKLNDANIDITLSSGGATNFTIPNTAGLELNAGTLRINGLNNALYLQGLLRITGGLFELGNSNQNNFIEYSTDGLARIEVSGGQLKIGSQLRRNITSPSGILKYIQTGGEVTVGVYGVAEQTRGVFEVVNTGSIFELSGNAKLTIARGLNNMVTPAILINTSNTTIGPNAEFIIGSSATPAAALANIGLNSSVPLPRLQITGNDPVVQLISNNLVIQDNLDIDAGGTLQCDVFDFILHGNMTNDGHISAAAGEVIFDHSASGSPYTISGSGTMDIYDFTRTGDGTTNFSMGVVVNHNFALNNPAAVMDFGPNTLEVKNQILVDGTLNFAVGSAGLIANGSNQQIFTWSNGQPSGTIDVFTCDNINGVRFSTSSGYRLNITRDLRLKRGVFDLNGNLLFLSTTAEVVPVSAFSKANMISTSGSYTQYGVRKQVPANYTGDIVIPIGAVEYMPMRLIFSQDGYNSGDNLSEYTFQIIGDQHTIIAEDNEPAGNPQISDQGNVLGMYFSLAAYNVGSGLRMDAEFIYHDDFVNVTSPYTEEDYIGARVFNTDVYKFPEAVNASTNSIYVEFGGVTDDGISGDYFAGIDDAIPALIPEYHTNTDGNVDDDVYVETVPGGGAPNGAIVHVEGSNELIFNQNNISFYKTIIAPNATLTVDATTAHRLGLVSGTGTLRIKNTGVLPSGNYAEFFNCSGGTLEYLNTSGATIDIMGNLPLVRKLILTGPGFLNLANNNIEVCENLIVDGAKFTNANNTVITVKEDLELQSGTFDNALGTLEVEGNLIQTGGQFKAGSAGERTIHGNLDISGGTFDPGLGGVLNLKGDMVVTNPAFFAQTNNNVWVSFNNNETIPVMQHISGSVTFTNVEIDNPAGVQLQSPVSATKAMNLTNGHLHTDATNILTVTSDGFTFTPKTGKPHSFINGPMKWNLAKSLSQYMNQYEELDYRYFPVGKVSDVDLQRPLNIFNRSQPRTWTVEYMDTIATVEPDIENMTIEDPMEIKTISLLEYWVVNSNTTSATNAKVGLSWGDSSTVGEGLANYQDLVVMNYNETSDVWQNRDGTGHTYDAADHLGTFVAEDATSFTKRYFTLGSASPFNPLPVTFLYFRGEVADKGNVLIWATATETNNAFFRLERSTDAINFETIATIEGSGNSNQILQYSYLDANAPKGYSYYRLVQVDFDGKSQTAPNLVALFHAQQGEEVFDLAIYPNPALNFEANIYVLSSYAMPATLLVSDITGRIMYQRELNLQNGANNFTLDTELPGGMYVVALIAEGRKTATRLIISD